MVPTTTPSPTPAFSLLGSPTSRSFMLDMALQPPDNATVTGYAVIISTDPGVNLNASSPSWSDAQSQGLAAWQATPACPEFAKLHDCGANGGSGRKRRATDETTVFMVGQQECTGQNNGYCNSYLKPNTTYFVRTRYYTAQDPGFQDSEFSDGITTGMMRQLAYLKGEW